MAYERDYPDPFLFLSDGIGSQKILFDLGGAFVSGKGTTF